MSETDRELGFYPVWNPDAQLFHLFAPEGDSYGCMGPKKKALCGVAFGDEWYTAPVALLASKAKPRACQRCLRTSAFAVASLFMRIYLDLVETGGDVS